MEHSASPRAKKKEVREHIERRDGRLVRVKMTVESEEPIGVVGEVEDALAGFVRDFNRELFSERASVERLDIEFARAAALMLFERGLLKPEVTSGI